MSLDDSFAALQTLAQKPDAFTTGTANNLAVNTQALAIQGVLQAGIVQAEAGLTGIPVADPGSLLTAVQNAQYLAQARASLAFVSRLTTVLARA